MNGTPHSPQGRGRQGDADLPVILLVIVLPTLLVAVTALGVHWGWW
jgi:hypothetical protein